MLNSSINISETPQPSEEEIQRAVNEISKPAPIKAERISPAHALALAEYLEKQGLHKEAAQMRLIEQKSEEGKSTLSEMLEKKHAVQMQKINEDLDKRPPLNRNTIKYTMRADTKSHDLIENFIKQIKQK